MLGTITDFCPTLLALVGVPHGRDMAGAPIEALFEPELRERHPVESVETHETPGWRAGEALDAPAATDRERLRQLEQLGYVDPDGD